MQQHVLSADSTRIVYDRYGDGPPLVLVLGAFNERPTGEPLARCLSSQFSVFNYDRRGRGASEDAPAYSVSREIEDLAAVIHAAGGSAAVFGYSSGAMLALQAAASGLPITQLMLYEPPYSVGREPDRVDHAAALAALIAEGRRGDAVEYFQCEVVGIPQEIVQQLRHAPFRQGLERIAHTLVYEALILGDRSLPSADLAARVQAQTLVLAGGAGSPLMPLAAQALAALLPHAESEILPAETHDLNPAALTPVLTRFLR